MSDELQNTEMEQEEDERLFTLARFYIQQGNYVKAARVLFTGDPDTRGRPTREELEFREYLERIHSERLASTAERLIESSSEDSRRDSKRGDGELIRRLKTFDIGGLLNELAGFSEGGIEQGITIGTALGILLGGLWIAEETIHQVPPVLHTSMNILLLLMKVLDSLNALLTSKAFGAAEQVIKTAAQKAASKQQKPSKKEIQISWEIVKLIYGIKEGIKW